MPQGLLNIGNTCSINTLIQCIARAPTLRARLLEAQYPGDGGGESLVKKRTFAEALRLLLREMAPGGAAEGQPQQVAYDPRHLVRCLLDATGGAFVFGEQQDLCELWLYVSDALCDAFGHTGADAVRDAFHVSTEQVADPGYADLVLRANRAWHGFQKLSGVSSVQRAIQGLMVGQVECKTCGYLCHNFEPFTMLSLDVPGTETFHINECLNHFFRTERMEEWKCDRCKSAQPAEKLCRFWKLPEVLVISLKRFKYKNGHMSKRSGNADIPETLEFVHGASLSLSEIQEMKEKGGIRYRLRSMGLHHGSGRGGHYTAAAGAGAAGGAGWLWYDDAMVMPIAAADVVPKVLQQNAAAYMLIYERQQAPPGPQQAP